MEQTEIPILLIDRSHVSTRLLAMTLKRLNTFKIISASSVDEGLHLLETLSGIRLVITGLMLPGMKDGLNLVRTIRRRFNSKTLPIVMLSTSVKQETVEQAISAGVDDYLFKPIFPDVLESRLQRLLDGPVSMSMRIGEFLVHRHIISNDQLDSALRYQRLYSSDFTPLSAIALYMGYIQQDQLDRLFLEERVLDDEDFLNRAHHLGILSPRRMEELREVKQRHHQRIGDILVRLRYVPREVLERAMRSFYKGDQI